MRYAIIYKNKQTGELWAGDWRDKDESDAILDHAFRYIYHKPLYRIRYTPKEAL